MIRAALARVAAWLARERERRCRVWFVIGDLSPFRGPEMLITGPLAWRAARREARHWVRIHPSGRAAVVRASEAVARLPRHILRDYV